jgi:uncharacterized membrane protein YwaF
MTWGFMSATHIISLLLGVAMIVGLYFILKGRSEKTKTIVLAVLSFSGIAAITFNLVTWGSPLEYLPLHLCSLNAMILPIAVLTKNKTLNNLLLLWSIGALFALIVNTSVADASIFSWVFFFFHFPHVLELGIPILMFALKLAKKDVRCIISTMAITASSYTVIHFINILINNYTARNNILDSAGNVIKVNYMFSITPENPLLALFYSIIPCQYWYMYLSFAVIAVYLGVVYIKDIIRLVRRVKVA